MLGAKHTDHFRILLNLPSSGLLQMAPPVLPLRSCVEHPVKGKNKYNLYWCHQRVSILRDDEQVPPRGATTSPPSGGTKSPS